MQRYSINTQQVTWELTDDEAVIIHFETSAYYGLNASGTYLWSLLADGPVDTVELADKIAARYGKRRDEIAAHLDAFLHSLKIEDLVTEHAACGAATVRPADRSPVNSNYQPPCLTKFGELEKLILSGE